MERHTCKLCHRRFANGRALGGHMKAHLSTPLPLPLPLPPNTNSNSPSQKEEEEEEEKKALGLYALRENPKRSFRFAALETEIGIGTDTDTDTDTGADTTESSRKQSGAQRRSKRKARALESAAVRPVSDGSPEEDVAMCLMMMSRDVWTKHKESNCKSKSHRCQKCNKAFRSQQAMCSHKRICFRDRDDDDGDEDPFVSVSGRVFRCPYCCKVFGSGQALGGHKRSHHLSSTASTTKHSYCFIDLNLPAPLQQDDFSLLS